jgi:hypothetical protein
MASIMVLVGCSKIFAVIAKENIAISLTRSFSRCVRVKEERSKVGQRSRIPGAVFLCSCVPGALSRQFGNTPLTLFQLHSLCFPWL